MATQPVQSPMISLVSANQDPFSFIKDVMIFTYSNAIMALGRAINNLLGDQPGIIASEMAISNNLINRIIQGWSDHWLQQLRDDEINIKKAGKDPAALAQAQGQMSVDNAASAASSTGLNGVMSMVTQDVSSKTTTYQNLAQQSVQVVTALLNFMSQLWVL